MPSAHPEVSLSPPSLWLVKIAFLSSFLCGGEMPCWQSPWPCFKKNTRLLTFGFVGFFLEKNLRLKPVFILAQVNHPTSHVSIWGYHGIMVHSHISHTWPLGPDGRIIISIIKPLVFSVKTHLQPQESLKSTVGPFNITTPIVTSLLYLLTRGNF